MKTSETRNPSIKFSMTLLISPGTRDMNARPLPLMTLCSWSTPRKKIVVTQYFERTKVSGDQKKLVLWKYLFLIHKIRDFGLKSLQIKCKFKKFKMVPVSKQSSLFFSCFRAKHSGPVLSGHPVLIQVTKLFFSTE